MMVMNIKEVINIYYEKKIEEMAACGKRMG
jgi:hypothetical protein